MEETGLVVANQNAQVAVYSGVDETGLGDVARLKPTNLILVQNTTRDSKGANPGQILDMLTEEAYDAITVVPLRVSRTRVLFPPGGDLEAEPICRSNDAVVPSPYAQAPQSVRCATCARAQWGRDGQKPACAEKLKLLVIVKDTGLPRWFNVGGVSIKALKLVLERIHQDIHMNRLKGNELALYDYFFTIRSEKVVNRKGSYYVARFDDVKKVANPSEFGPMFEQFVIQAKAQLEEDEAAAAEQKTDSAVGEVVDAEIVEA